ncbi:MAG TPA: phosphoribosyltransferase family protein, partial [Gammaproteobacteria bacterium]|nr:phosphoribosyltransferase family protein [Gammaproteobacteria bacterium]
MLFRNRDEAAQLLSEKLAHYRGKNPLILGIPRGAVPMGKLIAAELGGELDV